MQEWLKDKKNLPIVAGLGVTVLILAVVAMLFEMGVLPPQSAPAPVVVASEPPMPPPGVPGVPSDVPGVPNPAGPAAKVPAAPAAPPNIAKGLDPFLAPLPKPQVDPSLKNATRVRNTLPPVFIQQYTPPDQLVRGTSSSQPTVDLAPQVSSSMRMSGVVFTDNAIKAILETNGSSQQVQPGDLVEGGRVISIQADGLTLRTADNHLMRVPLTGAPTSVSAPPTDQGGGPPPPGAAPGADPTLLPPM